MKKQVFFVSEMKKKDTSTGQDVVMYEVSVVDYRGKLAGGLYSMTPVHVGDVVLIDLQARDGFMKPKIIEVLPAGVRPAAVLEAAPLPPKNGL